MKKTVAYCVDIGLDEDGFIAEAQCECAAGVGPNAHCKHVVTVICALLDNSKTGNMKREAACTDQLQTFKKPKLVHTGSPVKACDLGLGKRNAAATPVYDPRLPQDRGMVGYNDYVRNLTVNYQFSPKLPLLQSFVPANMFAADLDHDYLAMNRVDKFLVDEEVARITFEAVQAIEDRTRGQSADKTWHKERSKRLTASNFGRIHHATQRTDNNKLAYSLLQSVDLDHVAAIRHGKQHEQVAKRKFEANTGIMVNPVGLCVDLESPYLAASPDGLIGEDTVVEIKCPYSAKDKIISPATIPYLKEVEGNLSLDPKHNYFCQVQGQMMITHRQKCKLIIYTNVDMQVIDIHADSAFQKDLKSKLKGFYETYFKPALLDTYLYKRYNKYTFWDFCSQFCGCWWPVAPFTNLD